MENLDNNRIIYAFPRARGEEIQMALRTYKGKQYVDLRVWFQGKNAKIFLPTRKGISFFPEQLTEFKKGVERLLKAVEEPTDSRESQRPEVQENVVAPRAPQNERRFPSRQYSK